LVRRGLVTLFATVVVGCPFSTSNESYDPCTAPSDPPPTPPAPPCLAWRCDDHYADWYWPQFANESCDPICPNNCRRSCESAQAPSLCPKGTHCIPTDEEASDVSLFNPPNPCAANPSVDAGTDANDAEATTGDVVSPLDGPDAD
jgi:hypothetical protein